MNDARKPPRNFGLNWTRYAQVGFRAIIVADRASLSEVRPASLSGLISSVPVNFVRLAATEKIFDHIGKNLAKGERVQIAGFGTFTVSERAARQGRNPKTKEAITIAASKNVRFKVGKQLKDSL